MALAQPCHPTGRNQAITTGFEMATGMTIVTRILLR